MKFKKNKFNLLLYLILIIALFLRLFLLNIIPSGINNDELHFVLNSKSIFYGFSNIEGNINPFKLGELSSLIFAPIIGPLPSNLFTARLPYAIIGCLSILLVYLITYKLTKIYSLALISALVLSINPWSIYVSRTSFDAPVAIFFYLLTIYLLCFTKTKYLLLSLFTGLLAFNSYIGTKVIYFPIIIISSFFLWKINHKKNTSHYLFAAIFSFLVTINFIFSLSSTLVGNRINELQTPNSQSIKDQVNLERRQSLPIPILKEAMTNKYTIYLRNFIEKYIYNFSTDILFLNGDHTATGSLWKHGYFYYIDALLIIFGIIYLYTNYPNFAYLLGALILISPVPEALRFDTLPAYIFHSSLQFPLICILIGAGILFFWELLQHKFIKFIFVLVYLFCFINFINIYFSKSPIYQPESFAFSRHTLSKYLSLENKTNRQIYVLTQEPEVVFRSYLFYTNYYQKDKYQMIKNIYTQSKDNLVLNNIHFINHQKYLPLDDNYTLIYDTANFSFDNNYNLYISDLSDARNIFSIKNGFTCKKNKLFTYPNNISLKDLNLKQITENDFCQKYITVH